MALIRSILRATGFALRHATILLSLCWSLANALELLHLMKLMHGRYHPQENLYLLQALLGMSVSLVLMATLPRDPEAERLRREQRLQDHRTLARMKAEDRSRPRR